MEPSLIYSASKSLKYSVTWPIISEESEWTYFGAQKEANKPSVIKSINEYFPGSSLYIVLTRRDSRQVNKYEIEEAIENILGFQNFFIWDTDFKKVIEFNDIGVMRRGYI